MKQRCYTTLISILAVLMVIAPLQQSFAQPPATTSVALTYNVGETLTVSATPSSLIIPNDGSLSSAVTITSGWNLTGGTGESNLELDAWLSSASAALSMGSNNIPSSAISATETTSMPNGTSGAMPCTKSVGGSPAGAACPAIFIKPLTGATQGTDSSSTIALQVANGSYAAGAYTGTLTITLQVY